MYHGGYKVCHPHPGILLWGVKRGEYEMFYGSLTAEFNEDTDLLIEGDSTHEANPYPIKQTFTF